MKSICIIYHKNVLSIYPEQWIKDCIDSIKGQTYRHFEIFELNYGGGQERFTDGEFISKEFRNHIVAMNFLISHAFGIGADVVFNVNLDDIYHPKRFEKQIEKIGDGFQLVSSNFRYFGEKDKYMNMTACGDIGANLRRGHNVIAHPCTAMHRSFWDKDLHYNENLIGYEDLDLWKRAYKKGKRFFILEDCLLYYRIHSGQITKHYDATGKKKGVAARRGDE